MKASKVIDLMKQLEIDGEVAGKGENWEVEIYKDSDKDCFCTFIQDCHCFKASDGVWLLSPNKK